jgi:hypothetical protein
MTHLSKPVSRETAKFIGSRPVVVTIAPCGSQSEARIGLRLKGKRTQYVMALSDCYRWFAEQYGYKERAAKRVARKEGIPWKAAKRKFIAANSI